MRRAGVAAALAAIGTVFAAADPLVDAMCADRTLAACGGAGGRFALITLLRAAASLPILALVWRPQTWALYGGDRRRTTALLGLVALLLVTARVFDVVGGSAAVFSETMWNSAGSPWLFALAMIVAAPAIEEAIFRGLIYDLLSRYGAWVAIAVSATAWSALHMQYDLIGAAMMVWLGLVLGVARAVGGGVAVPLALHAGWNLRVVAALWGG